MFTFTLITSVCIYNISGMFLSAYVHNNVYTILLLLLFFVLPLFFFAVGFTPLDISFAVVLCVGFTPPISFILQVTLGVFLINAPLTVWVGMGGAWLVVFVVHECVYVCFKIAHRGQKVY